MRKIGLGVVFCAVLSTMVYGDCAALKASDAGELSAHYIYGFFCSNNRDINTYSGDEDALTNIALADLYERGVGLEQSDSKAAKFYEKGCDGAKGRHINASDSDVLFSCYKAAVFYQNGWGVKQDYKKAVSLLRKGTDRYLIGARFDLGKYF